jgi:heme oxygenase (mycobilin-producing)
MFIALSTFAIANGMTEAVQQAFLVRPHLVDAVPGFVRMDVFSPLESPGEFWLLTYWHDAESYHAWHRSHAHHESHLGIPKGLKLVPKSTQIRFFAHLCS